MIRKFIVAVLIFLSLAYGEVVITELHRDPGAGNKTAIPGGYSHVFVEVTNFTRDTFFFRDVFLTNGKAADSVRLFDAPVAGHEACVFDAAYIPPGGVAVILPRNYTAGIDAAPQSIHPVAPGTVMLTVNRANLTGGVANDDGMALYRGTRSRIDSLIDLAANPGVEISAPLEGKIPLNVSQQKGVSVVPASFLFDDERKYIQSPAHPLTPGTVDSYRNGIYIEYRLSMISKTAVRCSVAGIFVTRESGSAAWSIYSSSTTDNRDVKDINSGRFDPSKREFLLTIDIPLEERQYSFEITIGGAPAIAVPLDLSSFWADTGTLRITEIYPKGSASADQPEWFELQNTTAANVNINGWKFGTSSGDSVTIAAADYILPPGEFIVVCRDSTAMRKKYRTIRHMLRPGRWLALNNSSDTLTIWSPRGIEVDKAVYRSAWFKGWTTQSLERVKQDGAWRAGTDSSSWVLCDRPTPGLPGNASAWRGVASPQLEIGPVPFSPNGDGMNDLLSIRIKAPPNHRVKVMIFAFNGKLIKTFTGEKEVIYWNGMTESGRPAAPGPIYVVAEFTAGGAKKYVRKNGVLWR